MAAAADSFQYTLIAILVFYCWQGFMTTSRLASEASIRRRELVSPLPLPGWKAVAADVGVPVLAATMCFLLGGITYACLGGPFAAMVVLALCLMIPLRIAGRIVLQHVVVIAYPDLSDKVQRLVSMFIGTIAGMPFLIAEAVVCLPALFLQSVWAALIALTLVQIPLLAVFLFFAGKASERAIATGEPVSLWALARRR